MTKEEIRDRFAEVIMLHLVEDTEYCYMDNKNDRKNIAGISYAMADAMMAERDKLYDED